MAVQRGIVNRNNQDEFVAHGLEASSARTHPASLDRSSHMKTAVVDNQDRILNRTIMFAEEENKHFNAAEERIRNLETHLGLVTAPVDKDLYARIKTIEDKILKIEQLYPQIAAHCFNYGRAERVASTRPGGRVSKLDAGIKKGRPKKATEAESVQDIHTKMLKLREKLEKR